MRKLLLPMIFSFVGCKTLGTTEEEYSYKTGNCFNFTEDGVNVTRGKIIDEGKQHYIMTLTSQIDPADSVTIIVEKSRLKKISEEMWAVQVSCPRTAS